MCVEITYIYPHCGCISRIGSYACYHASYIAKTGFSLCCERYKTTQQDTRTGDPACGAHIKLFAKQGKVKKKRKKVKEEVEGSDGMGVEGEEEVCMSGAVQGLGEGKEYESEGGEEDMEHGERVIGLGLAA